MWYTCGSAKSARRKTVTLDEQFKKYMTAQTPTEDVLTMRRSGKIQHYRCTPTQHIWISSAFQTSPWWKKCSPQIIRREEFKYIDKYRTRTRGINRYKNWVLFSVHILVRSFRYFRWKFQHNSLFLTYIFRIATKDVERRAHSKIHRFIIFQPQQ